jgi:hypothetical protein
MDINDFKRAISTGTMPKSLSPALRALWFEAQGDWDKSHKTAQDSDDRSAAWVHAYLHRKEGDNSNAGYWYNRAGRDVSNLSFDEEWEQIVAALLDQTG